MARGWESKSVEQQQEEAVVTSKPETPLTPEQSAKQRERQGLMLSRQRVLDQLKSTHNPRHRQMLESALVDLDAKLAQLG